MIQNFPSLGIGMGILANYRATESFMCVATSATLTTATVVLFDRAWKPVFAGGGGAGVNAVTTNQDSTHFGIVDLVAGTSATGSAALTHVTGSTPIITIGTGQVITNDWLVRIPTLSDGTTTYGARFGLMDGVNAAPSNGIYFEYLSTAATTWRGITNLAATPTVASGGTAVTVASGVWVHLRIVWDGTAAWFYVDGVLIGSSSTNIPTAALWENAQIIKSAGAANSRDVLIDSEQIDIVWNPPVAA